MSKAIWIGKQFYAVLNTLFCKTRPIDHFEKRGLLNELSSPLISLLC
jgi:hypothetical protein